MKNEQLSMIDLVIETHIGLERQGPGSPEMTANVIGIHLSRSLVIINPRQASANFVGPVDFQW